MKKTLMLFLLVTLLVSIGITGYAAAPKSVTLTEEDYVPTLVWERSPEANALSIPVKNYFGSGLTWATASSIPLSDTLVWDGVSTGSQLFKTYTAKTIANGGGDGTGNFATWKFNGSVGSNKQLRRIQTSFNSPSKDFDFKYFLPRDYLKYGGTTAFPLNDGFFMFVYPEDVVLSETPGDPNFYGNYLAAWVNTATTHTTGANPEAAYNLVLPKPEDSLFGVPSSEALHYNGEAGKEVLEPMFGHSDFWATSGIENRINEIVTELNTKYVVDIFVTEFYEGGSFDEPIFVFSDNEPGMPITPPVDPDDDDDEPIVDDPSYVQGLLGEYFDANTAIISNPVPELADNAYSSMRLKRIDDKPSFTNHVKNPNYPKFIAEQNLYPETFAVRWTGFIKPDVTDDYRFKTLSDDGIRLWIGDELVINRWGLIDWDYTIAPNTITLEAGVYYPIVLEYEQIPLSTHINLFWESSTLNQTVPPSVYYITKETRASVEDDAACIIDSYGRPTIRYNTFEGEGKGLNIEYFETEDDLFDGLNVVTVDKANVNFDWGMSSPDNMFEDVFYASMTGYIEAKYDGSLSLVLEADDAIRVWIDGELIIDSWKSNSRDIRLTGSFEAIAGEQYEIVINYADLGLGATCIMYWESNLQEREVVPTAHLYTK